MSISLNCPGCSARMSVTDRAAGKTVRCPKCQTTIAVPVSDPDDLPVAAEVERDSPSESPEVAKSQLPSRKKKATATEGDPNNHPKRKRDRDSEAGGALHLLLVGGVLLVLLAVAGGFAYFTFRNRDDQTAVVPQPLDPPPVQPTPKAPPDSSPVQPTPKAPSKNPPRKRPTESPLKPFELAPTELNKLAGVDYHRAFSVDGKWLATVQAHTKDPLGGAVTYSLQVWELETGKQAALMYQGNDRPRDPIFSPDGKRVAAIHSTRHDGTTDIAIWEWAANNKPVLVPTPKSMNVEVKLHAFAHDGEAVYYQAGEAFYRVDVPDGTVTALPIGRLVGRTPVVVSPTRSEIVIERHSIQVFSTKTRQTVTHELRAGFPVQQIALSSDGKTLGVLRYDNIELWDTTTWKLRTTLTREWGEPDATGDRGYLSDLSLSADGTVVALSTPPGKRPEGGQLLNIWSGPKYARRELPPVWSPLLSPDGKSIGGHIANRRFVIIEVATGKERFPAP